MPERRRTTGGGGAALTALAAGLWLALAAGPAPAQDGAATQDEAAAWREAIDWPDDCRPGGAPPEVLSVTPLGDGERLLLVTCALHAYQTTSRAWRLRAGPSGKPEALPLLFPFLATHEEQATLGWRAELVGLPSVEGDRLTLVTKARGLGDCGEAAVWDLSEPLPVAVRYHSRRDCPSPPQPGDADWTRWPALSPDWLRAHRPAERGRAAAEALAALAARAPDLAWLAGTRVEADLDCDGAAEPWALGLDPWSAPPAVTLVAATAAPRAGPIPVDPTQQLGLCGIDLAAEAEPAPAAEGQCPSLAIYDGLCDALRLTRNPRAAEWRAERN